MKTSSRHTLLGILAIALAGCNPETPQGGAGGDDAARQQLEESRVTYEKQAADMEARSKRLAEDLAALQQSIRDKESADLSTKLEALQQENDRLQAEALEARRHRDEIGDQIAALPQPPALTQEESDAPAESWTDPAADYTAFYEELNPYGRWLDVEGYGYAWHPNVAERSVWQPYVDGRWAWSDQGWAWDSNEPFGWACYHYGRWVRLARHGWVWVPGREWAPAWVSWRSGDDCVGWAPLPPGKRRGFVRIGHDCDAYYHLSPGSYVFIKPQHFGRPSYVNVCLPSSTIANLFQSSVNVTNIVRANSPQGDIFVHRGGPDRDWVERRLGGQVPRAQVQVARHLDRSDLRRGSDRRAADAPVQLTAAPIPALRAGQAAPPKAAERVARPALADAWAQVPEDRRQGLRDHIARQSRGPQPPAANANAKVVATVVRERPPLAVASPEPSTQGGLVPPPQYQNGRSQQPQLPQRPAQIGLREQVPPATMQNQQAEVPQAAEAQRREREAESARIREAALAQQQMQQQAQEQARIAQAQREAEIVRNRGVAAAQQQQMAEQQRAAFEANQQREAARRDREANAQQQAEARRQTIAAQQNALVEAREKLQRDQAEKARQIQQAAQRQQELTNAANAAAMRAQQEVARRQAAEEAARQNAAAMRQQQEAAQRAAQEAARRAADDARRAADDAARQQRDNPKRQEENSRRSR